MNFFKNIKSAFTSLFSSTPVKIARAAVSVAIVLITIGGLFKAGAFAMTGFNEFSKAWRA